MNLSSQLFEVGDLISGRVGNRYAITSSQMLLAKVIGVDGGLMKIKIIEHEEPRHNGDMFEVPNSLNDFYVTTYNEAIVGYIEELSNLRDELSNIEMDSPTQAQARNCISMAISHLERLNRGGF